MNAKSFSSSPLRWGAAIASAVAIFLLVTITATLVTFIMPVTYASSARVLLSTSSAVTNGAGPAISQATELESMQSELVLTPAAAKLDLARVWGKKYNNGAPLRMTQVQSLLRGRLDVRLVPRTSLAEIRCFSDSPDEAAQIANEVAVSYCSMPEANGARIVDTAAPSFRPVKPNKPLNIFLGGLVGSLLGGFVAGLILLLAHGQRQAQPPPLRRG